MPGNGNSFNTGLVSASLSTSSGCEVCVCAEVWPFVWISQSKLFPRTGSLHWALWSTSAQPWVTPIPAGRVAGSFFRLSD